VPQSEPATQASSVRVELGEVHDLMTAIGEASAGLATLQESSAILATAMAAAAAVTQRLRAVDRGGSGTEGQTRRMVEQLALTLESAERKIAAGLGTMEREITQASNIAGQLRLASLDSLEPSLRRAVLTAGEALGKNVSFAMETHAKRIDAQMLSSLRDPLLHIVRNAVAHGIEAPAVRQRQRKPVVGRVRLLCLLRGGTLRFICEDDGQGIDVAALRDLLVQRQVLTRETAAQQSEAEIVQHIFSPGVSTTRVTDAVSGRGVGLDVVREAVQRLHGSAQVASVPGRGTRIELQIPLDLHSTPVIECHAGGRNFSVPTETVSMVVQFGSENVLHGDQGRMLEFEGRLYKLINAATLFGEPAPRSRRRRTAVMIQHEGSAAALEVERVVGTKIVVQKPLPRLVKAASFIGGAAVGPLGTPDIVLDPSALLSVRAGAKEFDEAPTTRRPILVIDDSLTTRTLEQSILETAGYAVEVAASAEEGLQKAAHGSYGLFLVDVEMPGMDGFEFIRTVKSNPELRMVPCILVTSRSAEEDKAKGRDAGAADYVVKGDFNQQYLLSRISELVLR
jgi:two-component system chemotaxis sensor kinase CheA